MKKELTFNGLILILVIIFSGCSTVQRINIINDDMNVFLNNRDYNKDEIKQFIVNGAVILPHFAGQYLYDGKNNHEYRFIVYAASDKQLDYIQIRSYQINISGELGNKTISKELNEKYYFKKLKNDEISKEYFYASDVYMTDFLILPVDEKSQIEVILDVSVKGQGEEERKTLKIKYKYKKTKEVNWPT